MSNYVLYIVMTLFILVCLLLVLLVLIQKGRGGGLSSAFGGAGGNTAFGSKTGDVLTWATSIVFGVFLVLAVALNLIASSMGKNTPPPATPLIPTSNGPMGTLPIDASLPADTTKALPETPARSEPAVPVVPPTTQQ